MIFVLALVFNITKNLNRIINYESKSYWPEILVFNYSQKIKHNFNVNYPDSNDKYHKKNIAGQFLIFVIWEKGMV